MYKNNKMNKFEKWFLTRIIRRQVQQGFELEEKHIELYQMIRDAHRAEFYEDNAYTADDFLSKCFLSTQSQNIFGILRK